MENSRFTGSDYGVPTMEAKGKEAPQIDEHRLFMRRNYSFFGGVTFLYALFYTFCLYKNASGITYPFFAVGTLVYFYLCTKRSGVPWKKDSSFYLVSILLLGVSVCLTDNSYIIFITRAGVLLLLITLMLHQYLDDSRWTFSKYLLTMGQGLLETIACLGHPVSDGNGWLKEREQSGRAGKGRYVLLGILVLIPLLFVIMALLVSADAVFGNLFIRLFAHINLQNLGGILVMTVLGFFGAYCFVAMLNKRVLREECTANRNQEPVLAITFTSVLAVIYLVFCAIQIVGLFMGRMELPEGYTYASYARQGFFQLLAVCVINLAIVLTCVSFFKESRVLKGILTVISLCTYILVASSAYRMLLYIRVRQLTFLRFLVLWALVTIALMLAGIIAAIHRPEFRLLKYLVAVVTLCYIVLAFVKPDYWIARYNMGFVQEADVLQGAEKDGQDVFYERSYEDYSYLSGLSADAAPVLASEANYGLLSERSEAMRRYYERMEERAAEDSLRSFNLSRYLAGKAIGKN